jgi:hypothetical protein
MREDHAVDKYVDWDPAQRKYIPQGSDGGTVRVLKKAKNPKIYPTTRAAAKFQTYKRRAYKGRAAAGRKGYRRKVKIFKRKKRLMELRLKKHGEYRALKGARFPRSFRKGNPRRKSSPAQLAYRKLVKKYGVKGASRHWRKRR